MSLLLRHHTFEAAAACVNRELATLRRLILESGVRPGAAVNLKRPDVYLQPAVHAELGYLAVRKGKSKNAKRNLSLTARAAEMLKARESAVISAWVLPGDSPDSPILGTSLDHEHNDMRTALKLPEDFVVHSLRHTMLTRHGEAGARGVGTRVVTAKKATPPEFAQVVEFKRTGA
jgi:integrase